MSFGTMLTGTGTFKRPVVTYDASSAPKIVPADMTTLYEDVPIRVDDLGGGQEVIFGQQIILATHVIYCEPPGELRNGDVCITEGLTFRLINPQLLRAAGTLTNHLEIYATELAP